MKATIMRELDTAKDAVTRCRTWNVIKDSPVDRKLKECEDQLAELRFMVAIGEAEGVKSPEQYEEGAFDNRTRSEGGQ